MKTGAELIAEERQRQIEVEGWTPEHDDQHCNHEMLRASMCYTAAVVMEVDYCPCAPRNWPWDLKWWKPKNRISNLVRAGALIAAEIDRLNRIQERK